MSRYKARTIFIQAGQQADEARCYDECGDVVIYEGTPESLLETADLCEQHARTGGGGSYDRRVASTIREAVYTERPDLRPQEPAEEDDLTD